MSARNTPLTGDALLVAVTDAMVALHERHHDRAPVTANTQLLGGDLLACVLGGVHTDVRAAEADSSGGSCGDTSPARTDEFCLVTGSEPR